MTFTINIDGSSIQIPAGLISGQKLRELTNINEDQHLVINRANAIDIPIENSDHLIITGDENFVVGRNDHQLPDDPCLRNPICITVNGKEEQLTHPKISISDLRALAGSGASDGVFAEMANSADEPLGNIQRLIIQDKDAFITVPCGNVGDTSSSAVIKSLEDDLLDLQCQYPNSLLHQDGSNLGLIIHDVPLPEHWSESKVDVLFQIVGNYPFTGLDMFYVSPELRLRDGKVPQATQGKLNFTGRIWQRFSWHYTSPNVWRPGVSNLVSHLRFSLARLQQNY